MYSVGRLVGTSSTSTMIISLKLGSATKDTAIEVTVQRQVNRTRGARVLYRRSLVSRVAIHLSCLAVQPVSLIIRVMATAYGVGDKSLRGANVGECVDAEKGLFGCGLEILAAGAT